jgi:hypothetical protein
VNGEGVRHIYDGYLIVQDRKERTDELVAEYTYFQGNIFKIKRGTTERWVYNYPEGGWPRHLFDNEGTRTDSIDMGWFGDVAYRYGTSEIGIGWAGGWTFAHDTAMPFVFIPESNEIWMPKLAKSLNPLVKSSFMPNVYVATRGSSHASGCCGMLTSTAKEDPNTDIPCPISTNRQPGFDIYIPPGTPIGPWGDVWLVGTEPNYIPVRSPNHPALGLTITTAETKFNNKCCEETPYPYLIASAGKFYIYRQPRSPRADSEQCWKLAIEAILYEELSKDPFFQHYDETMRMKIAMEVVACFIKCDGMEDCFLACMAIAGLSKIAGFWAEHIIEALFIEGSKDLDLCNWWAECMENRYKGMDKEESIQCCKDLLVKVRKPSTWKEEYNFETVADALVDCIYPVFPHKKPGEFASKREP